MSVTEEAIGAQVQRGNAYRPSMSTPRAWTSSYLRRASIADCTCALVAGLLAARIRFGGLEQIPVIYVFLLLATPVMWWICVLLAGGYDIRVIGLGSDEFRRIIN